MTDEDLDEVAKYVHDPLGFAQVNFPWGEGELKNHTGPRAWQAEIFTIIRDHLSNPLTRFTPLRIAVASGHGIGKSAGISMLTNWAESTMADTRCVVTANTESQLRTKTWPEINKWFRLAFNRDWFKPTATSFYSVDPDAEKSWRVDATPWSENNTEAFAGLHNEGKRLLLVFDEASAISDKVWEVAEGALTDENTEIIWIVFGNPTRNSGRFRECFRRYRHLWVTRQIDSRTVEGTNKTYLDELVATYGEDSDLVKVRVRGIFPVLSAKQFISVTDVDAATARILRPEQFDFAPKIITCDPAWEGDDELVIAMRQGMNFRVLRVIEKNDNDMQIASIIAALEVEHQADQVFVDGGYGTGIISAGRTMGRDWIIVWFGGKSTDPGYLNKRAEMWGAARDWLKEGGAIDKNDQVLYNDLIGPETVARPDGKVQLESKKAMKIRGLPSPGRADALVLSFAYPVSKRQHPLLAAADKRKRDAFDPFDL